MGRSLIALLCFGIFANMTAIGAFPSLLPDIAESRGLADWQLGLFAGAFGFARMVADLPAGLFAARHLALTLAAGPVILALGVFVLAGAESLGALFAGRALMGAGQSLNIVAGLTAILHAYARDRLAVALNAFELSAMTGLLGGAALVALLPRALDWNTILLVACVPQALAFALLPAAVPRLPRPVTHQAAATPGPRSTGMRVPLAFAAGCVIAITYSSLEQLTIPIRSRREFGLDRGEIARVFMLMQTCDIAALIPVGFIADRAGPVRVLAGVTVAVAVGSVLIGFGSRTGMTVGVMLFGVGLAGWMTPLSVLRQETPPTRVAWRTGLYRGCVDACTFIGPFLGGLFVTRHLVGAAFALFVIAICLLWSLRPPRPPFGPTA